MIQIALVKNENTKIKKYWQGCQIAQLNQLWGCWQVAQYHDNNNLTEYFSILIEVPKLFIVFNSDSPKERIEALLEEEDIKAKFELLTLFRQHVESTKLQYELNSLLLSYLMESDSDQRITNFDVVRFHGPGKGLSRYVANQLFLSLKVKSVTNKRSVLKELDFVLHNLHESKNPLLKVTTAKKLVDLVNAFLGDHFYQITHHPFLSIYFVPYENKMNNAAFDINTNSIAVFRTKEKKTQSPEYIFLHEFGHILHCTVFKTINEVPESFVEFNQKINKRFFSYSEPEKLEIYADLFSIAVMLDSEYESLNPFIKTIQGVHLDKIKKYFVNEIKRLN